MHHTPRRLTALTLTSLLAVAACGGGSDTADTDTADSETAGTDTADTDTADTGTSDAPVPDTTPSIETTDETEADIDTQPDDSEPGDSTDTTNSTGATGDEETAGGDTTPDTGPASTDEPTSGDTEDISSATFDPSPIGYRTINLIDEPVDLYVITDGIREAWSVQAGVGPGEITEFASPPVDGRYLVTTAGAGDPTCVIDCVGHIAELSSSSFVENGPARTVLVHPNADTGEPAVFEIWELPDAADAPGSSNAMPSADPTTTLVSVSAVAVSGAEFGLRLSIEGTEGCATHLAADSRVIGGNQVLTFDTGQAASFSIHGFDDSDCAEAPLGGPFAIDAAPGARFHGILFGEGADLDALVVEMVDGLGSGSSASDDERASAVTQMTAEVTTEFGLDEPAAACVAELLVERIGSDVLLDDTGSLVDLDSFDDDVNELAGAALFDSVDECGIDPAVFGG